MSSPSSESDNPIGSALRLAISHGYYDGVEMVLKHVPNAAPKLLGAMVHEVLNAEPYEVVSAFRNHGGSVDSKLIPRSENGYELNLSKMVGILAAHGADFSVVDESGQTAAQRAFDNSADNRIARRQACLEIVRHTLQQKPDWQPDIRLPFMQLAVSPGDKGAEEHRADVMRHINNLGGAVTGWLLGETPSATTLRLIMPRQSLEWWKDQTWQNKPQDMPWMGQQDNLRMEKSGLGFALGLQRKPTPGPTGAT